MNDTYAEWLVKRKTPVCAHIIAGIMGLITVGCVFLAMTGNVLNVILMFLAGGATCLVHRSTNIEFEYLFVNAQLTVDKILGRSKRKTIWEGTVENMELVAPSGHSALQDYKNQNRKKLDFSSRLPGAKTYTVMYQSGPDKLEIIIEPDENILKCLWRCAPRKVIR